jgi:hypothetical protein
MLCCAMASKRSRLEVVVDGSGGMWLQKDASVNKGWLGGDRPGELRVRL